MIPTWPAVFRSAALSLLALCVATLAGAANLTDVRVGVHGDHTRVVLETDAKAPYIVDAGEKEIIVHVDAAATAEAVTAKSPHLIWVKVEPTQIGADIHLQMKQPSDVKALVLTGPDRIVLDLYPKKSLAGPLPAPEQMAPEEETAAAPGAEAEAEPEEPAGGPAAAPAPSDVAAATQPEAAAPEAASEAAKGAGEPAAAEPAESAAPPPTKVDELAGAPEPITQPSDAVPGGAAQPEPTAAAPAPPSAPTTPAAPVPPRSLFGSPYVLGAAAVALLVVFVFLRRRLRSAEKSALPSRRDELPPPLEPPASPRAVAVGAPSTTGESLFDVEAEAIGPPPKDEDMLPQVRGASAEPVDETERRISHLERRLEELVDARERLERQVAAQTEELRVQRAAIARTQRVLRTVAPRGDEEPSGDPLKS